MFIVLLRFSGDRTKASPLLPAHNEWIRRGFDDGVFLLVGSLQPGIGGGILAHGTSRSELQRRVDTDPFVVEKVVTAEILEVTPSRVDPRLSALLE
jgi:uncharacterized protein YciI